jgi:hypothetical protein
MNQELKIKIENNLFPRARPAVEPWEKFPWHLDRSNSCDTWKIHSSQASRDAIFDSICKVDDKSFRGSVITLSRCG